MSEQNIVDRFYGTKDPVADKLLKRAESLPSIKAPEDKTITTLWVGGVTSDIDETDLQEFFYQFGEIAAINVVQRNSCAFVQFTKRESAEFAAQKCFGKLDVKVRLSRKIRYQQCSTRFRFLPKISIFDAKFRFLT